MKRGVILYGPPASGKDTVTRELAAVDSRYRHFHRLKVGAGRTAGYRLVSDAELAKLRSDGDVIYENARYDATYAIDRQGLDEIVEREHSPVVHLGQVSGVRALLDGYPLEWLAVCLWCSRDESERRLRSRQDARPADRLAVWDATLADVRSADPAIFTLTVNTGIVTAGRTARIIDSCCR